MIDKLISRIFKNRNAAHIQHWKTNSFSKHEALGDYYEEVIDITDKLVEAHQGTFGLIGDIPEQGTEDITKIIRAEIIWLNENRAKIARSIPALENIVDELTGLHMKTLYKLENLR